MVYPHPTHFQHPRYAICCNLGFDGTTDRTNGTLPHDCTLLLLDEQLVNFLLRPFLDTIVFRWGIRSLQQWWVLVYGYPQEWSSQTWMVLSSAMFSMSHMQTSGLPSLQQYRRKPFPTKVVGRLVLNALISWGWLCPVYERRGMWASIGAQVFWQALRLSLASLPAALGSGHASRPWSWFEKPHCNDDDLAEKAGSTVKDGNHSGVEGTVQEPPFS